MLSLAVGRVPWPTNDDRKDGAMDLEVATSGLGRPRLVDDETQWEATERRLAATWETFADCVAS